jgi:1-acyl-sn-glycerol-3-phosphate acyltransferase
MSVALRRPSAAPGRPLSRHEPLYRSVIAVAVTTFRAMDWRISIEGAEHIPLDGPAVIAANHVSYLDFLFVGLAAHRRHRLVRFMAIRSAFDHPVSGPLLRALHHIPVDREHDPVRALEASVEALRRGEVVGLHPEGKIRRSADRPPGKTGAVRMALETGAPLIPAAVWGTQRFLQPGVRPRFPRHVAISVRLGPAIELDDRMSLVDATAHLLERIDELEQRCAAPAATARR